MFTKSREHITFRDVFDVIKLKYVNVGEGLIGKLDFDRNRELFRKTFYVDR